MLASWTYEGWAMTEGAASHPTAPKPGALGTPRRRDLAALEERRIRAARRGAGAGGGAGGTSGTFAPGRPAAGGGSVETGAGNTGVQEVDVGEGERVD